MFKTILSMFKSPPTVKSGVGTGLPAKQDFIIHELTGDEVPRYPPFVRGLPVIDAKRLLVSQDELIRKIKHTLAVEPDEFEEIVLPVIHNFAEFVHLLPASETHHHRGAGGLFRHSLEVASNAVKLAEGRIFTFGKSPRDRKEEEPKWRVAAFAAGLTHDIGKAATDVAVINERGDKQWQPFLGSLTDWGNENKIDRYFIRWRDNRHKNHEQSGLMLTNQVLTNRFKAWIGSDEPEIIRILLEAAACRGEHPLSVIVKNSDSASVERDLRQGHSSGSEMAVGVPVERHILDAARRLVNKGDWTVNKKGSRVWATKQGVFIAWSQAAREITDLLSSDKVPGIPRDPDTLADLLLDRDLAKENDLEDASSPRRYFQIAPVVLDGRKGTMWLRCLKLSSPDLLFSYDPPGYASVLIKGHEEEVLTVAGDDPLDGPDTQAEATSSGSDSAPARKKPTRQSSDKNTPRLPGKSSEEPTPEAESPVPSDPATLDASPATEDEAIASKSPQRVKARQTQASEAAEAPAENKALTDAKRWLGTAPEELQRIMNRIFDDIRESQVQVPNVFAEEDGMLYVRYPSAVRDYGKPAEVMAMMADQDWIVPNPENPARKVHDLAEGKGLLFQAEVTENLRIILALDCDPLSANELKALAKKRESEKGAQAGAASSDAATTEGGKKAPSGPRPPKYDRQLPHELIKHMDEIIVRVRKGEIQGKTIQKDGVEWRQVRMMNIAKELGQFTSTAALEALGRRKDVEVNKHEILVVSE